MISIENLYQKYKNHPRIVTDHRKIESGNLFWGIKGEKFDGNSFASAALEAGAAFAIIDNKDFWINDRTLLVEDSLLTLQQLARHHRRQLNIPFIAICGSNGKTTTKELTAAVLSKKYKTFATAGNLNNHIGVPLTLLSIHNEIEIAVIEIGANHLHETEELCAIAEPDFGVITNNGKDHLEGFGNIQNVIKANAELYLWLKNNHGTAFVNTNHPDLVSGSLDLKKITYGKELVNEVIYEDVENTIFSGIKIPSFNLSILSQLFGQFNNENLATAYTIGHYFKVPNQLIKQAIEEYTPGMNRSQVKEVNGNTYYIDCYNANPSSMKLSLESFSQLNASPKRVILADMLELGEYSFSEHKAIIDLLKTLDFQDIILIGKFFGEFKQEITCTHFNHTEDAKVWLSEKKDSGWNVLLKGSRGYKLENLLP